MCTYQKQIAPAPRVGALPRIERIERALGALGRSTLLGAGARRAPGHARTHARSRTQTLGLSDVRRGVGWEKVPRRFCFQNLVTHDRAVVRGISSKIVDLV